ncbi:hypothetical protein [Flavobacterium silvaticum]|uniref:Uncharacterized protein n=1 Tax=Flavobacterium silvaticum TaxID=1852020 RepID=A0A972JKS2_9FLAO|nr:hypothetical protein [Flavobacterium silvaticum]NMH29412.1 hypothetical protein [Flavobacterium silvaticum]
MKSSITLKTALLTTFVVLFITLLTACSSSIKGTASDRTGTNGATNGTGKIAKSL